MNAMTEWMPWIIAAAAGLFGTLTVWGLFRISGDLLQPVRRRLSALRDTAEADAGAKAGPSVWSWFAPRNEQSHRAVAARLAHAGFRAKSAVGIFYAARIFFGVAAAGVVLTLVLAAADLGLGRGKLALLSFAVLFAGVLGPSMFLDRRALNRHDLLLMGLPDALDLLVACTEAGLGLNAALERVTEQMPASHPELAHELGQVNAEIRAGVDRSQAMRNLAERTGLDEIRGLVTLISHSARLGTGIAATLRVYAEEFRDRRMQRAEEVAATLGTRLIFPLIICLWPSFFIVAVGPSVVGVMHVLATSKLPGT